MQGLQGFYLARPCLSMFDRNPLISYACPKHLKINI